MPRAIVEDDSRLILCICPDDKAMLMRAAAVEHINLADFMLRHAMHAARKVIEQAEQLTLTTRDTLAGLKALEDPPAPNAKLLRVAHRMPTDG